MAHSAQQGTYAQFSVVARLREGTGSSLSTFGIILEIQKHLKSYGCICNVAFSPPNFIIHLPTVQVQVAILSCKAFAGTDYVLDLLPWSPEYASFEMPWIIRTFNAGNLLQQNSDNGKGKGEGFISLGKQVSASSFFQSTGQKHTGPKRRKTVSSSSFRSNADKNEGLLYKGIQIEAKALESIDASETAVDFSYLMIVELKSFYYEKFHAFEVCSDVCKEMYDIVQLFSKEVEKGATSIYEHNNDAELGQNTLDHLRAANDRLNNSLWFMSEQIFGLQISMGSIYQTITNPIDLTNFLHSQPNHQMTEPTIATAVLEATAQSTVSQIYDRSVIIATEEDLDGTFYTQIWCASFHHGYRATMGMTKEQAHANAIYRFLKHLTNVLGYSVEDHNSDVLYTMVSQINYLNETISDLQICVDKMTVMVHDVSKNLKEIYSFVLSHIFGEHVGPVKAQINDLFTLLEHYSGAVQGASTNFEHHKRILKCTKFLSTYPAKSD